MECAMGRSVTVLRSPRIRGPSGLWDDRSRRTNALTVPIPTAGPAQWARVASSVTFSLMNAIISAQVRMVAPSMATAPSFPAAWASRYSLLVTWCTTIVYWFFSSSTSANTYGSSSRSQNSASVHQNAVTPLVRPVTWGRPVVSPGSGGA